MKSIKIKLAVVLTISIILGAVLYAKAHKNQENESAENSAYTIKSSATTNLNASMKAHPRASEYTSAEYSSKMAPETTDATKYLAMHDASNDGNYQRRTVPQGGERSGEYQRKSAAQTSVQSDNNYGGYAVRSAGGKDISTTQAPTASGESYEGYAVKTAGTKNANIQPKSATTTAEGYAVRRVESTGTDYEKAMNNATVSDNAYETKRAPQNDENYGGYAVRSAGGKDISATQAPAASSGKSYEGYAVRSAGTKAMSSESVQSVTSRRQESDRSYGGYAVRSAGGKDVSTAQTPTTSGESYEGYTVRSAGTKNASNIAQYDNAKRNDQAYEVKRSPQSNEEYGGYAVRSAGGKDVSTAQAPAEASDESYGGYAVRSAGTNTPSATQTKELAPKQESESYGGYEVKSAGAKSTNIAQQDNAVHSDQAYEVKKAPSQSASVPSNEESYGGYAVKSAGKSNAQESSVTIAQNQMTAYATPRANAPSSGGTKIYNNKGHRMSGTSSQMDRSVIVMPKRGRSIAGIVVQDNPGRSIIVQAASGTQSTYRYGEIDALINL